MLPVPSLTSWKIRPLDATCDLWSLMIRTGLTFRARGEKKMNALQCARYVYRTEGIRGFYRGLTASYAGISETMICFLIYETLKKHLAKSQFASPNGDNEKRASDFLRLMMAAAFSKGCASCIAYPHGKYHPYAALTKPWCFSVCLILHALCLNRGHQDKAARRRQQVQVLLPDGEANSCGGRLRSFLQRTHSTANQTNPQYGHRPVHLWTHYPPAGRFQVTYCLKAVTFLILWILDDLTKRHLATDWRKHSTYILSKWSCTRPLWRNGSRLYCHPKSCTHYLIQSLLVYQDMTSVLKLHT